MTTKQRIVESAVKLFNERGMGYVTLRDIAGEIGISPGNLAYHYKNKDFIIEEAYRQMESEREELLSGVQEIPSFENINAQMDPILHLSVKYRFFHTDSLDIVRNFPEIAVLKRKFIKNHIKYIKAMLDYSVGVGNMQPEPTEGVYQNLSDVVWMVLYFWQSKGLINEENVIDMKGARNAVWQLITPHLTAKGKHQFQKIQLADVVTES